MSRSGGCAIAIIGGGIGLCLMAGGAYAFLGAATLENYEQYPAIAAVVILGLAIGVTSLIVWVVRSLSGGKQESPQEQKVCPRCGCHLWRDATSCQVCGKAVK